ncbi:hypothetical protein BDB01DRAFT_774081 [Pilobolus umbonatus]|nr:hypothetical protein BDB01DRAFT_774081 [Pilobolus umbonatus]
MKSLTLSSILTLLLVTLSAIITVQAQTSTLAETTTEAVFCALTICPTSTATPTCYSSCKGTCEVIEDVCCPGNMKAVCYTNDPASTTIKTTSTIASSSTPTSTTSSSAQGKEKGSSDSIKANTYLLLTTITMMAIFYSI